jgi:Flp pilus assembly protein TadG
MNLRNFRKRHRGRRLNTRRGAAAVEMALVLPLFLLVVFGIVEFGRAFMVEHLLANAARVGARKAIVNGSTNSEIEQTIKGFCSQSMGVDEDAVTVTVAVESASENDDDDDEAGSGSSLSNASRGDMCTITVSVPFDEVSFLPGSFLGGAQLRSTCAMEHE